MRIPVEVAGAIVALEGFVYRPRASGKHPVAIFNHGSAGGNPKASHRAEVQARYFADRGFVVLVPMRRGRGASDGTSLEGEEKNCDVTSWEPGLRAAYDDLTAAIDFASNLPSADSSRIVLSGVSRGGFLSVGYAAQGERRNAVAGVINFSGGWVAQAEDNCPVDFNAGGFRTFGKHTPVQELWLYGEDDPFYTRDSIFSYRDAFGEDGGQIRFELVDDVPGNGHQLAAHPDLWRPSVDAYLKAIGF